MTQFPSMRYCRFHAQTRPLKLAAMRGEHIGPGVWGKTAVTAGFEVLLGTLCWSPERLERTSLGLTDPGIKWAWIWKS